MERRYLKDIITPIIGKYTIIERIYGGMMNVIYLVENKRHKKYLVYIPNGKANKTVDRQNEKIVSDALFELKLTTKYIYFDTVHGIKIREYIEGTPLNKLKSEEIDYQKAADLLHLIHDCKTLAPNDYNPFDRLGIYENKALSYRKESNDYRYLKDFFIRHADQLKFKHKVLCHNDYQKSNIIVDNNGKYSVIDFEFAGNNDPIYDIATFANDSIDEGEKLFNHYFVKPTAEQKKRFYLWRIFVSLQWHNVAIAKHYQKEGDNTNYNFLEVANYFLKNAMDAKERYLLIK